MKNQMVKKKERLMSTNKELTKLKSIGGISWNQQNINWGKPSNPTNTHANDYEVLGISLFKI
jgi:hypothetical protein